MTQRKAMANKILLLGVDGMDPRLTRKYVDQGKMPNVKKILDRGAARRDLTMLGGHPTITPPMWTTLACGCYSNVHGITDFMRQSPKHLDVVEYNLDSRLCEAEPLWNVFAEAGKKTLVWHWPGSSWPPTSDSENLYVVDGTSPGSVGMAIAQLEGEFLVGANANFTEIAYKERAGSDAAAPCVVEDLEAEQAKGSQVSGTGDTEGVRGGKTYIMNEQQMTGSFPEMNMDMLQTPIKSATGWANAPADAKEFTFFYSKGLVRRVALILKDSNGKYNKVAVYKNKKESEPMVILEPGVMAREIIDESIKNDKKYRASRSLKVLKLSDTGDGLVLFISAAMDIDNDSVYSPKRIYKEIVDNVGYPTPTSMCGAQNPMLITDCMWDCWNGTADWQSKAILHLIESEDLDVVFSHFHAIDLQTHMFVKFLADPASARLPHDAYEKFMIDVYQQTDYYLGKFVHLLDEGWTISVFSDHALVAPKHHTVFLGDASGVNVRIMQELGYTVLKTDENGNEIPEIDWSKTKAVATRGEHIIINLKGRDEFGIVDPKDKYELEEQLITDLYSYKDKETGHRIVSVALRNKDAVLLGQGGPQAGDIIYWLAEGYNFDHGDCLSTTLGEGDTSVAPIFLIAGPGIKEGFYTNRIIRQIDFAPTIAAVGGVRMPAQCEGAPAYQIFVEEF